MRKSITILSSVSFYLLSLNSGFADWQADKPQASLVGSVLTQQYSQSSHRLDQSGNYQTLSYFYDEHQEVNDIFNRDQSYEGLKFTQSTQLSSQSALYFSTEASRDEQHLSSVLSVNNWRFGASTGRGEDFVKTNNAFAGIDPYFIHGGRDLAFSYYGANVGYQLKQSTLFLGSSRVEADRVEDRQTNYIGFTAKNLSASVMNFQRGGASIGKGIDLAMNIKGVDFGYRQLSRENGAHSKTFSFAKPTALVRDGSFGFAVESTNNPLNTDEDDLAFMFTFSGKWGKAPLLLNLDDPQAEQEQASKGVGVKTMAAIGVAAVAGVAIASSGSSDGDNAELIRVPEQDEAAFQVLNRINPESVRLNREHGGWIYRNANGTYGSTEPIQGGVASVNLGGVDIPNGTLMVASYHTHGGPDPRYDNENFSPQDLRSDIALGIDGYLGTPAGLMKLHDVESGEIITVREIAN